MSDLTWQAAPETAVLEHNEVHLWRVWLTQAAAADRLWPLLAADEAARARAFVFARHRQAFVTARGMLRLILSRYVGEPAAELRFDYGARGKPRLHEDQGVQFNLSHSGEMALVAVNIGLGAQYAHSFVTWLPVVGVCVGTMAIFTPKPVTNRAAAANMTGVDDAAT